MKLFTPGPIAMDPETIAIGGTQSPYFRNKEFSTIMQECDRMLKQVIDAPYNSKMIFLTASGTAAMEASVINLFTSEDKVIIIAGGTFGKRFQTICEIHHIPFSTIELAWDEPLTIEMLAPYENQGFTGMLVNLCETSTGQLYPIKDISEFCQRNNICLVVDAISSFLCDPFSMKNLNIDVVIVSSQKGLALHAGMAFVAITKETFEKRCIQHTPPTLYFRFSDYEKDIERGQTPYTPAVSIIYELHDKLTRLISGGIENHLQQIENLSHYFRKQLTEKTNLSYPDYTFSNCLTAVHCPDGNAESIVNTLKENGIFVTPCAGNLAPVLFRVAHMSTMLTVQDIDELICHLQNLNH